MVVGSVTGKVSFQHKILSYCLFNSIVVMTAQINNRIRANEAPLPKLVLVVPYSPIGS